MHVKIQLGAISQLVFLVEKDESPCSYGTVLTSKYLLCNGLNLSKFNEATNGQGIDDVMKSISCNDESTINHKLIKKQFK